MSNINWKQTKVKSSILIDNLNDDAARVFAAMPQRLYIIRDQKVWIQYNKYT